MSKMTLRDMPCSMLRSVGVFYHAVLDEEDVVADALGEVAVLVEQDGGGARINVGGL